MVRTMSRISPEETIFAQSLMGRKVQDADGSDLGRVYELVSEQVGDELCVTALLVGPATWLTRFGWTTRPHGRRVPWESIATLSPRITLRKSIVD